MSTTVFFQFSTISATIFCCLTTDPATCCLVNVSDTDVKPFKCSTLVLCSYLTNENCITKLKTSDFLKLLLSVKSVYACVCGPPPDYQQVLMSKLCLNANSHFTVSHIYHCIVIQNQIVYGYTSNASLIAMCSLLMSLCDLLIMSTNVTQHEVTGLAYVHKIHLFIL